MSPPLLLLHGQPGGREDWAAVTEAIAGRARVLAPDRPGWDGHSRAVGLRGNAEAAIDALDGAGIDQAVVVGHSFGGAVACRLAIDHPERVARLVLAAPAATPHALARLDHLLAAPLLGDVASVASLSGVGLALATRPVRGRIAREMGMGDAYLRAVGWRLLNPASWRSFVAEQRTLVRELPGLEGELGRIVAPTTVIAGELDSVVPLACVTAVAELIPGAELITIIGADHLLPLREPARFAELLLRDPRPAG